MQTGTGRLETAVKEILVLLRRHGLCLVKFRDHGGDGVGYLLLIQEFLDFLYLILQRRIIGNVEKCHILLHGLYQGRIKTIDQHPVGHYRHNTGRIQFPCQFNKAAQFRI